MPISKNLHKCLPDREPTPPQSKSSSGKSSFVSGKAQGDGNTKDPVSSTVRKTTAVPGKMKVINAAVLWYIP